MWGLPWSVAGTPTLSLPLSGPIICKQLFGVGVDFAPTSPHLSWDFVRLCLGRSVHPISLWDLCIFPVVSGKWCSLKIIHTSGSYNLSAPSLRSLSFEGRNTIKTSHSGLNAPKSPFLHTVPLWLSVNLIYCKRKLLWWRLSDAVLYVGNSMSLGVVLLQCTVRIIVVCSPLGPWPTMSQDLCLVWVHLIEWLLNPTQKCLWTCKFMSFSLKKTKTNKQNPLKKEKQKQYKQNNNTSSF